MSFRNVKPCKKCCFGIRALMEGLDLMREREEVLSNKHINSF